MSKNPVGRKPGYVPSESTRKMIGDARRGSVSSERKAIIINGVKYAYAKDAATELNLAVSTLRGRIRSTSEMWKGWYYE